MWVFLEFLQLLELFQLLVFLERLQLLHVVPAFFVAVGGFVLRDRRAARHVLTPAILPLRYVLTCPSVARFPLR